MADIIIDFKKTLIADPWAGTQLPAHPEKLPAKVTITEDELNQLSTSARDHIRALVAAGSLDSFASGLGDHKDVTVLRLRAAYVESVKAKLPLYDHDVESARDHPQNAFVHGIMKFINAIFITFNRFFDGPGPTLEGRDTAYQRKINGESQMDAAVDELAMERKIMNQAESKYVASINKVFESAVVSPSAPQTPKSSIQTQTR